MPEPADHDIVINALRLGWYLAEVKGRNRPDAPQPATGPLPSRLSHFLPLRSERSPEELRIEAQAVMAALAHKLEVAQDQFGGDYPSQIEVMAKALDGARKTPGVQPTPEQQWNTLADKFFYFDAHIQDLLSSKSDIQATAYLLGRGLSEAYWSLTPDVADGEADSWSFLLGTERCQELSRYVGRLSAYFNVYTAPAIGGSLVAWQRVAADAPWRQQQVARQTLYLQIRRWYELLILGQDPSTLVKPYSILKSWRAFGQAVSTFATQLVTLVVSVALIVGLAVLTADNKSSAWVNTLLGLLSAVGVTTAALQARLKNAAQSTLTRLRQDVYTDLVASGITDLPDKPGVSPREMRKIVVQACQDRSLTTVSSA